MLDPLLIQIEKFLKDHCDFSKPVLLALSGGPDSLCLLHLLLKYRQKATLDLHIAHVDHRWREESGQEAATLQSKIQELGLPFHLKRLNPEQIKGNLEAACRIERLQFFKELSLNYGFQAVLMAHHADDQAETVLKKVFEGSYLPYLSGLQNVAFIEGIQIWRPFLEISKNQIENWLSQQQLVAFDDCTNRDPRFLRAKLRTSILPGLSKEFGKEIGANLCRLGQDAGELKVYFEALLQPYLSQIEEGIFGSYLDLSEKCPESMIEIRYLIKRLCEKGNVLLSRSALNIASSSVLEGIADKWVSTGNDKLFIDRKRLFLVKDHINESEQLMLPLLPGDQRFGLWKVMVDYVNTQEKPTSWKESWKGYSTVTLPLGDYHLGSSKMNAPFGYHSPISKWWTNHKIPTFLRNKIPVVWSDGRVVHEFLTGKNCKLMNRDSSQPLIQISLIYGKDAA